jgi:hypothetical protein
MYDRRDTCTEMQKYMAKGKRHPARVVCAQPRIGGQRGRGVNEGSHAPHQRQNKSCAETVKRSAGALEGVDDVERGDGFAAETEQDEWMKTETGGGRTA